MRREELGAKQGMAETVRAAEEAAATSISIGVCYASAVPRRRAGRPAPREYSSSYRSWIRILKKEVYK